MDERHDYLLELDGDTWTRHTLPAGFHAQTVETGVVAASRRRVLVKAERGVTDPDGL